MTPTYFSAERACELRYRIEPEHFAKTIKQLHDTQEQFTKYLSHWKYMALTDDGNMYPKLTKSFHMLMDIVRTDLNGTYSILDNLESAYQIAYGKKFEAILVGFSEVSDNLMMFIEDIEYLKQNIQNITHQNER